MEFFFSNYSTFLGAVLNVFGFFILTFDGVINLLGRENMTFATNGERLRDGAIWRNITLGDLDYYEEKAWPIGMPAEQKACMSEIDRRLIFLEAWTSHENNGGQYLSSIVRKRRAILLAVGLALTLVGMLLQLFPSYAEAFTH